MAARTKLGFDISRTIHFYETVLATLAVIVWRFYFVIFNPDVYPMNLAWLTRRMSEREMFGHANLATTQIYTAVESTCLIDQHAKFHPRNKAAK